MTKLNDELQQQINELTVEDAKADSEWNKKPSDFREYLQYDKVTARAMKLATPAEREQIANALSDYLFDDKVPDYDQMPAVVAITVEHVIEADKHSIETVYLTRYKQHVAGKLKGRQKINR